jgi:hypothetical protein
VEALKALLRDLAAREGWTVTELANGALTVAPALDPRGYRTIHITAGGDIQCSALSFLLKRIANATQKTITFRVHPGGSAELLLANHTFGDVERADDLDETVIRLAYRLRRGDITP